MTAAQNAFLTEYYLEKRISREGQQNRPLVPGGVTSSVQTQYDIDYGWWYLNRVIGFPFY